MDIVPAIFSPLYSLDEKTVLWYSPLPQTVIAVFRRPFSPDLLHQGGWAAIIRAMQGLGAEGDVDMPVRGIRGATTAATNTREEILESTQDLLRSLLQANNLLLDDVAGAFFTTTVDLNATYPALGARLLGWDDVPLMCSHEMAVPGSLPLCIRVMLLVNTDKAASEVEHVYLKGAVNLRQRVARDLG